MQYKKIIFSSSATVYGNTNKQPVIEFKKLFPISTYGSTKIACEYFLNDISKLQQIDVISLRYFNPVGSHKYSKIFESISNNPNNLMPRIVRVALKLDKCLSVYGDTYKTKDGTGERDYIHIDDLVEAHISAMNKIHTFKGYDAFNIGTGNSISVKELIHNFEEVNKIKINYEIKSKRDGDIAICYADPKKANIELGWTAKKDIRQMCADALKPFLNYES